MKKSLVLLFMIILVFSVHAQMFSKEEKEADKEAPKIDELEVIQIAEDVAELNWWVSDNLGLSRYEIFKDGVRVKTKPIGGNKQSSKYQDLNAFGDHRYTLSVYDVAGNTVEKNITLNKTKEEQVVKEAIKTVPEKQVIVEAPIEPEPTVTEETVEEQPADQSNFLAVIIVLVILAVFWKLLTLKPTDKERPRDREIGMNEYIKKRKRK